MIVTVKNNQTLADIALQECGDLMSIIDIAETNGLSLTQDLRVGDSVDVSNRDYRIKEYYDSLRHSPATALTDEENEKLKEEGIEFWTIEDDFIVS